MSHHLATGKAGEQIAVAYLRRQRYRIFETNWRFRRAEIDIIAKEGNCLVICEVKTRTGTYFGMPERFISKRQKELLADAASEYVCSKSHSGEIRFDIISIVMKNELEYKLKHIKDAFFPGLQGF